MTKQRQELGGLGLWIDSAEQTVEAIVAAPPERSRLA